MCQVGQDQLESVLRCAGQLRIRGLESELSRESSMEPDTRPSSQQSGSSKRKTSPKFHFLKNRRKCLLPSKLEDSKSGETETVPDDVQSINDDEPETVRERGSSPRPRSTEPESDGPVDFTIKNEQFCSSPENQEKEAPDMADMAAFLATASAAVRNVGTFQVTFTLFDGQYFFCHLITYR